MHTRPHFVYILIATAENHYAEMAAVSVATLRATNPNARITVLTDSETANLRTPAMDYLRSLVADWIVRDREFDTPFLQSRHFKLSSRKLIEGDFIFLDSDTLIARDLTRLARYKDEFSAVRDYSGPRQSMRDFAASKGWAVPEPYFNSGVFSVRDTPAMHRVFDDAHAIWSEAYKEGVGWDQLPFNAAFDRAKDVRINWIPASYNAQIGMKTYHAIRPHIYHVFSSHAEDSSETILRFLSRKFKATGELDEDMIVEFANTGNPWMKLSRPGQYIALARPFSAARATLQLIAGRAGGNN